MQSAGSQCSEKGKSYPRVVACGGWHAPRPRPPDPAILYAGKIYISRLRSPPWRIKDWMLVREGGGGGRYRQVAVLPARARRCVCTGWKAAALGGNGTPPPVATQRLLFRLDNSSSAVSCPLRKKGVGSTVDVGREVGMFIYFMISITLICVCILYL